MLFFSHSLIRAKQITDRLMAFFILSLSSCPDYSSCSRSALSFLFYCHSRCFVNTFQVTTFQLKQIKSALACSIHSNVYRQQWVRMWNKVNAGTVLKITLWFNFFFKHNLHTDTGLHWFKLPSNNQMKSKNERFKTYCLPPFSHLYNLPLNTRAIQWKK